MKSGKRQKTHGPISDLGDLKVVVLAAEAENVGRRNVLRKLLADRGASVWPRFELVPETERQNLIVVSDEDATVTRELQADRVSVKAVVSSEWASEVLSRGSWVDPAEFRLRGHETEAAPKVEVDSSVEQDTRDYCAIAAAIPDEDLVPREFILPERRAAGGDASDEEPNDEERRRAALSIPRYACQRATLMRDCPNEVLCRLLSAIAEIRELQDQSAQAEVRARVYHLAAAALRTYPYRLRSVTEASSIPFCGDKILKQIQQYLDTGWIADVDVVRNDKELKAMWALMGVHGIGKHTAHHLVSVSKVETLTQLRDLYKRKAHRETIGLAHYNALNHEPISADEANELLAVVTEVAAHVDDRLKFEIVGGFRRGKKSGHDVDVVFWHETEEYGHVGTLALIVQRLVELGVAIEVLKLDTSAATFHFHAAAQR